MAMASIVLRGLALCCFFANLPLVLSAKVEEGILFGESTPVWCSRKTLQGTMVYEKLEQTTLKKALEHYKKKYNARFFLPPGEDNVNVNGFRSSNVTVPSRVVSGGIYPTILVTTDFNRYSDSSPRTDEDIYDQLVYQMAFWTGVDARLRQLKKSNVRLRIAGFIIGHGREATPYLKSDECAFKSCKKELYATRMQQFWSNIVDVDLPLSSFHMVATATDLPFGKIREWNIVGTMDNALGYGKTGEFCGTENSKKPVFVFWDDQRTTGINTAVQKLAQALGIVADGKDVASRCSSTDGYLMGTELSLTDNSPQWSSCSEDQFETLSNNPDCLDRPRQFHSPGTPLPKLLPGVLVTADQQCAARGYLRAEQSDRKNMAKSCSTLPCYRSNRPTFWSTVWTTAAAEGSSCLHNKYCFGGKCKTLQESSYF